MGLKPDPRLATKLDPNARLTVSEFLVLVSGMTRADDVLLYETRAGVFGELPDNGYEFDGIMTAADNASDIVLAMFSNDVGDVIYHLNNNLNVFGVMFNKDGAGQSNFLLFSNNGASYEGSVTTFTLGVRLYLRLTRTAAKTSATLFIYSDADRLIEITSKTLNALASDVYDLSYFMTNQKTGTAGAASGDMSNPDYTWLSDAAEVVPQAVFQGATL